MSSKWRRFEVLLPLQFNDGREIPGEWLAEALLEVVDNSLELQVTKLRKLKDIGDKVEFFIEIIWCELLSMRRTQPGIVSG